MLHEAMEAIMYKKKQEREKKYVTNDSFSVALMGKVSCHESTNESNNISKQLDPHPFGTGSECLLHDD